MPTPLSSAPTSSPSVASSFSTAAFIPRSMFVPWSPSPIAVSRRTSSTRCSATAAAKSPIQARTSEAPMLTGASAPAEGRRVDRGVPEPDEIVVELEQRDRAAGHLQRGDVVADQPPLDRDPPVLQEPVELPVDDVELDQRGAAHAVDEGEHAVAGLVRQVLDDGGGQKPHDRRGARERLAVPARLAVDADADLHLVVAQLEARLAGGRRDARRERHAHAPALPVDLAAQIGDLAERLALLGRGAA